VKFGDRETEFNRQIFFEDKGHVLKIFSDNNLYLVQVTSSNPTIPTVQVQNLTRTMMPSKATEDDILAAATKFASDNQNKDKFTASAEKLGPLRNKEVALHKNDYNLMGVGIARQVIKWGFDAKEGDVSTPFRVADKYVVINVEHVVAKGIPNMDVFKEEITMRVRNEKKGEMLKKKMLDAKASSIDQLATKLNTQVVPVPGLTFMSNNIPNFGNEPVITGTAFKMAKGKMSAPVVGNQGVFVIQLDNITSKPPTANLADYGKFIVNNISQRFTRGLVQSIVDKSDIEDNRANFY
jgi:peptidyl-prolyl cis-trans isomerase D